MDLKQKQATLEKLYLKNKFKEIIEFWDLHAEELDYCQNEESALIAEVISASLINQGQYSRALSYVNSYLYFLQRENQQSRIEDEDIIDDMITFYDFKIEIYHRTNKIIHEYAAIHRFLLYDKDDVILQLKEELEDAIFDRFVLINKILLFVTFAIKVLVYILPSFEHSLYISVVTSIVFWWIFINLLFYRRVRDIFIRLLNKYFENRASGKSDGG
ncbi:hypothetical protein EYV94_18475 [Puteibacter caeruleilacunae]|nr:hypothetical protein EYV94_18475 [Puteibacter caeruleilacunae]